MSVGSVGRKLFKQKINICQAQKIKNDENSKVLNANYGKMPTLPPKIMKYTSPLGQLLTSVVIYILIESL